MFTGVIVLVSWKNVMWMWSTGFQISQDHVTRRNRHGAAWCSVLQSHTQMTPLRSYKRPLNLLSVVS